MVLYGISGSGKTSYFKNLYPDHPIFHASDMNELRTILLSPFRSEEEYPFLVNVWFDIDLKKILEFKDMDIFLELHYMEDRYGIVENQKEHRFMGFKNLNILRKERVLMKNFGGVGNRKIISRDEYIKIFGTIFPYIENFLD